MSKFPILTKKQREHIRLNDEHFCWSYIQALEGALDITNRVMKGEQDDSLAADYSGTGYEYHPTVIQAYRLRAEVEDCARRLLRRIGSTILVERG